MARRKFKHHLIYYSTRLVLPLFGFLPLPLVAALGRVFGFLVFTFARGERRKTLESIQTAFPKGYSPDQVERLGRAVWVRLGWNLFETLRWFKWSRDKIASQVARSRGWEHAEKALAKKKGILLVTAHLGNWELLVGYLSSRHPISAVAQKLFDDRFDRLVTNFREKNLQFGVIKRGLALRGILQALKENRILLAAVDQDTGKDGVFVPFFGKSAWTQSGVARIAQKTGAPIVPAFMVRGSDGRYEMHMEREIEVPSTGNREKDMVETVRRYTEVVESYVKAYPDQWMFMHERWKTRPENEKR